MYVDPAGLIPGINNGDIHIGGPGNEVVVTVSLTPPLPTITSILHGATLQPGPVAPGQIVIISGHTLGPSTGVSATPDAGGIIETTLAGVSVLFDGIAAPLLLVREDQINAIVPYEVNAGASSQVQVGPGIIGSIGSTPVPVQIVDVSPGIFTADSSGHGQAAAINSDFTPNSVPNPASRGSVIMVFGTGAGQMNPPGKDGLVSNDLRRPVLPVTATIGGHPADVLYAGSAPALVSGVFQANIRIPQQTEPGAAPIELKFGEAITQPGVTIAVR